MRITTKKDAKKFIGKEVRYAKNAYTPYGYHVKILGVSGKNVLVELFGEKIWLWLPDVILESIEAPLPTQQP